jgi:hypothetical protein
LKYTCLCKYHNFLIFDVPRGKNHKREKPVARPAVKNLVRKKVTGVLAKGIIFSRQV